MLTSVVAGASTAHATPNAALVAVDALSQHRLLATYDKDPSGSATTASNYTITGPGGTNLPVLAVSPMGNKQALFSTGTQQAVTYQIAGPAKNSPARSFTGSVDAEPVLQSAVGLSSTKVALTFSEAVGAGATEVSRYQITIPAESSSGGGGNGKKGGTGSGLSVTAAVVDQNPARVILTTATQAASQYLVKVGDIKGQSGEYVDPTANVATFGGIPVVNSTAPKLLTAAPQGDRNLLLTFDKPLSYAAGDPALYASTPNLFIHSAALQSDLKQVVLGTGVQFAVSYTVTANVVDAGGTAVDANAKSATFTGTKAVNTDRPRVVSATSTGNDKAVVQFSKPMADNAADPGRYRVDQAASVGTLAVAAARFVDSERLAVELTTQPQAEVTYRASVANVTDLLGNPMADKGIVAGVLIDPSAATFLGTGPVGAEIVDTDGDGLYDHEENVGREVLVHLVGGGTRAVQVTSDVRVADTDGDGLDDFVEKGLGIDPRDVDTDDDGLSDAHEFNEIFSDPAYQDTDADGLTDGLEVTFYNTSDAPPGRRAGLRLQPRSSGP